MDFPALDLAIIFWGMLALVAYTYFGYPVLAVVMASVWPRPCKSNDFTPTVCLLVAAYNEEKVIEAKVRNSLALDYPSNRIRIVIASDGSTDATNEIVRRYSDRGVCLIESPRRGKTQLLNDTIPTLDAEVITVSDANIELRKDALRSLMRPLADPAVGGAWGNKIYRNPAGTAAGAGESLYLRYEKFLKLRESRIGSIVAGEGSLLAFRRELFRPLPLGVPDDFALSTNVIRAGKRLIYEPSAITFEDVAPSGSQEFQRKVRIIERGMRGFFGVIGLANPFRTGFYAISLISRQFLRRAVAFLYLGMGLMLPWLAPRGPVYQSLLLAAVVLVVLALAGGLSRGRWRGIPLFFAPYYFCLVNLAAIGGTIRWLAGSKSVIWEPTRRS